MSTKPKISAFICTRSPNISATTRDLVTYLSSVGVEFNLLIGKDSIFSAYDTAIKELNPADNDIAIFCHDDIEIINRPDHFLRCLYTLLNPKVGFIGVGGTRELPETGVWWTPNNLADRRGIVWHGNTLDSQPTYFGSYTNVVALDGVFLAASGKTLNRLTLTKPDYFSGQWDFYDIQYTTQAHLKGLHNFAVPIHIRHESIGELAGRDSWHKNRQAFVDHTELPLCTTRTLTLPGISLGPAPTNS